MTDGGYCLLSVPSSLNSSIFDNIRWSSGATARDQINAINEAGGNVSVSELGHNTLTGYDWNDIDVFEDVIELRELLRDMDTDTGNGNESLRICPSTSEFLVTFFHSRRQRFLVLEVVVNAMMLGIGMVLRL